MTPTNERIAANRLNQSFAQRVGRWKRFRLAGMIASVIAGVAAIVADISLASVPCFLLAIVFCLFYFDAREQQKQVEGRRWSSATPKTSLVLRDSGDDGPQPQHMSAIR